MSNFAFLSAEWPELYDEAQHAERLARVDPRTACFYARRTLELTLTWLYRADTTLVEPNRDTLKARISERTMRSLTGGTVNNKMQAIRSQGNNAVHGSPQPVPEKNALRTVAELFHVMYWLARNFTLDPANLPADGIAFSKDVIPERTSSDERKKNQAELKELAERFVRTDAELAEERKRNADLGSQNAHLRAQIADAKAANAARSDTHDYNEDQTRDLLIDVMLREAGWPLSDERDREYPVTGMPNATGTGWADYVLWDDDGRPLAVIEAKRTKHSAIKGQQQARLYADSLESETGQRPVIFYTNGYETWLWDDTMYPPREVRGYYTKDELRLLIQRRARASLAGVRINSDIAGRPYQQRAIRRVGEEYESGRRKALVVMATGAGKTRTTVALVDQLMRAGWVKRVLFLADRIALVTQTVNAFKQHLPDSNPVNLVTERGTEGRVYVSTYPTMMGLIDDTGGGVRRFGPGHFDLVVIDEAHRSVFKKYREIFAYFDSLLLGLTATPKDEVDRNTYRLFELQDGQPTDVYSLEDAADDGYLVMPQTVSVPLHFQREGIRYDELSEEEKEAWDELEWNEDGETPDKVDAEEVNTFLFNKDTVDKALGVLMTKGLRVAGGDRLGKTIVFAKNTRHAEFIAERFDIAYPEYSGGFARVITHQSDYAQDLIDKFATPDQEPHIAISVDMLDTGIDVPEVVNLVLFKLVRSKTKFWQMIGRGTRLCPDLFGPDRHKEGFLVFDLCQNIEFFNQDLATSEGHLAPSLGERLLRERLELLRALDSRGADVGTGAGAGAGQEDGTRSEAGLHRDVADLLHRTVAGMNPDSFLVRPHRRHVEIYSSAANWHGLSADAYDDIAANLAGLPTEYRPEEDNEDAKRFDLLALRLQLGRLTGSVTGEERARRAVQELASALLSKTAIPRVREQQEFLEEVAGDEWWVDVTPPMLESMRRRMRSLVQLVERVRRTPVYTDFEDELGEVAETPLRGAPAGAERDRLDNRVRRHLRAHLDHPVVLKLRGNRQVTAADIGELEGFLLDAQACSEEELKEAAAARPGGLGGVVRFLLGMDRDAVAAAFADFHGSRRLEQAQERFVNLIIGYLESNGVLEIAALYESPFTALAPNGPEALFSESDIDELVEILGAVQESAVPGGDEG